MAEAMAYNRQTLGQIGGGLAGYDFPQDQRPTCRSSCAILTSAAWVTGPMSRCSKPRQHGVQQRSAVAEFDAGRAGAD